MMTPNQTMPQTQSYRAPAPQQGAQSQLPQGSFRSSCNDVRMDGQTLLAFCQKSDGTWQTSAIGPASQCTGDIQNVNGELRCSNETGYGSSMPQNRAQPAPQQPK